MNKENITAGKVEEPTVRITRARAKSLATSASQVQRPPRPEQNRVGRGNAKRVASDENKPTIPAFGPQKRRRATLSDVTNVLGEKRSVSCLDGGKSQKSRQQNDGPFRKKVKVAKTAPTDIQRGESFDGIGPDTSNLVAEPYKVASLEKDTIIINTSELTRECIKRSKLEENLALHPIGNDIEESSHVAPAIVAHSTEDRLHEKPGSSESSSIKDIDNQKDPLMCSLYASDIYQSKRVAELSQRPSIDYMVKMQPDITPSMRGILVDWLVEVSEEYKLVPDTLYLTVNLIDRYLSGTYVEKQRLQLLGVTCMLIASKYEEMNAPQVEEFCYITANTYAREEVLKMERKVLNNLCFQLSVPTTKTFLRRYVHAAQATYKVPMVDLEFSANYLAELTLVEYSFLQFLPSLIAASAVFLARWTLNESVHPWNPTLEHYTCYKAADLKDTVFAMHNLQLNITDCPLNAIRDKYRHEKFNGVANRSPPRYVESVFLEVNM